MLLNFNAALFPVKVGGKDGLLATAQMAVNRPDIGQSQGLSADRIFC